MNAAVDLDPGASSQPPEMFLEYLFQCRRALEQIRDCIVFEKSNADAQSEGGARPDQNESSLSAGGDSSEMAEPVILATVQEEQNLKVLLSDALMERDRLMGALEECRAESGTRLARIGQLQDLHLATVRSLEEEKKRREELQLELTFQKDVSKHLARYVRSMKSEVKNLCQQYNQLEASLELTRCAFAAHEKKQQSYESYIKRVEELCRIQRSRAEEQIEKERQFELREAKFREIEEEKDSSICVKDTIIESMKAELEQERSKLGAIGEEFQKLSLLVERQFRLCEKEQLRNKSMDLELRRLKESCSSKGLEETAREEIEKNERKVQELLGKLEAERLRSEQISLRYDESQKRMKDYLLEMKRQRDEAMESAVRAMERERSLKKVLELRDGRGSSLPANASWDRNFCLLDSGATDYAKRDVEKKDVVDELVDEILLKEPADIEEEPFDLLLPTSAYESRKGRAERRREAMKCCSDLPYGLSVHCSKCKGSFHASCAEKVSPLSSRKKGSKFVCDECKAKTRTSVQAKPRSK
ncbi:trichohyalin-like [Schistocerca gregaria]|uniref:trichohyalin-like n=1 Tax=Schistocerca gregaria TaxID=7010 RepID=UPI00211E66B4|nr:trichohyalin-like [Schistocerca gregaria]